MERTESENKDEIDEYSKNRLEMLNSAVTALETSRQFEFLEPLGSGTYGDVVKMWDPIQSTAFAVKVVESENVAECELMYWPTLHHAHVVPVEEIITPRKDTVIFIMPLYFKTLQDLLWETEFFDNSNSILCVKQWLKQALHGLDYIHSKDLCHLDIKVDNILISYDSLAVLSDFSFLSHTSQPLSRGEVGLPYTYRPPEACSTLATTYIEGKSYDMWGFGVMVIETLTQLALFNKVEECNCWEDDVLPVLLKMLQRNAFHDYLKKSFPTCELTLEETDKCMDFINKFLQLDPMLRITAGCAANHPFLDISNEAFSAAIEIALACPGFTKNHDSHHQEVHQRPPSSTSDAGCHGDTSSSTKVENIFSAINCPITSTSTDDNRTADVSAMDPNFLIIRTPILPRRRRPLSWSNPAYTNPNDSQIVVYGPERPQETLQIRERRTFVIGCDGSNAISNSWLRPITSERTGDKRGYEKDFELTGIKKKRSCISGVKQRISDRKEKVENNSTSSVDEEKLDHKRITKSRRKPNRKRRVAEPDVDKFKSSGCGTPAKDDVIDGKNGSSTILRPRKSCVGHPRGNSKWEENIGTIEIDDASDLVIDSDEIPLKLARTRIFSPSSLLGIKCEADKGTDKDLGKGGDHSTMKQMVAIDSFCKYQSHFRKNKDRSLSISIQASRLLKNLMREVFEELGNANAAKEHLIVNKQPNFLETSGSENSLECKRWKDTDASSVISNYLSSRDGRSEPSLSSASGDAPPGSAEIQKSRDSDKVTLMSCSAFNDQKVSQQIFSQHFTKRFNHGCIGSLQDMSKPELIHLACKQSNHSDRFVLMKTDEEQVSSSSGELFYSFERDSVVLKNDVFKSPKAFRTDSPSNIKSKTFTSDEKGENLEPENPTITWVKRLANACQQETRDNILSELLPQTLLVLPKDLKKDLAQFITSLFFDANLIATKERLPVQSTVEEKEENNQEIREDVPESSSNKLLSLLKQSETLLNGATDIVASLDEDTYILRGDALMETKEENGDAAKIEFGDPPHQSRFSNKFRDLSPKKLSHSLRIPIGREGEKPHRIDSSKYKRLIWDEEPEVTEIFDECSEAISYLCDAESVESNVAAQCQGDQTTGMERAYESYQQKKQRLSSWYKFSKTTLRIFFCCLPGPSVD